MLIAGAVTVGEFDLAGMLAMLASKVKAANVRRIVFDSVDLAKDRGTSPL